MIYWMVITFFAGIFLSMLLAKLSYDDILEEYPRSKYVTPVNHNNKKLFHNYDILKYLINKKRLPTCLTALLFSIIVYLIMGPGIVAMANHFKEISIIAFTKERNYISLAFFIFLYFSTNLIIIVTHFSSMREDIFNQQV